MRVIRDEAVSGAMLIADRRGGAELLATLERGQAAHVVAVKLDRLFRDAGDAHRRAHGTPRAWRST